jgi:1-acyl-sn-glycerol-3-phosphate acyltransferase
MAKLDNDHQAMDEQALALHIEQALAATAPSRLELEANYRLVQQLFKPLMFGSDDIPQQPCLFVGNHCLFALDAMVLTPVVQKRLGRFLRPMGDKVLWSVKSVGSFLTRRGGVIGDPRVCSALMENGEDLLVFPGGSHEAVKPQSELYTLQWKQRYGFIKLAAHYGYTIVPFGMVGPDEFYDHYIEGADLPDSRLGKLLQRLGLLSETTREDLLMPIPVGAMATAFPKPQRCYIGFGEAVDLSALKGKPLGRNKMQALRDQVATEIEQQLQQLLLYREQHKNKDGLLRKLLTL